MAAKSKVPMFMKKEVSKEMKMAPKMLAKHEKGEKPSMKKAEKAYGKK